MCLWNCYLYTHSFDADPTVENYSRSFFGPKTGGGFKVKTPRTRNKSSKRTKTHTEEDMNKGKDLVGNLDSLAEDDKARLEFMMEQRQIHDRFLFLFCITFGLFLGWCFFFFFNNFLIFWFFIVWWLQLEIVQHIGSEMLQGLRPLLLAEVSEQGRSYVCSSLRREVPEAFYESWTEICRAQPGCC